MTAPTFPHGPHYRALCARVEELGYKEEADWMRGLTPDSPARDCLPEDPESLYDGLWWTSTPFGRRVWEKLHAQIGTIALPPDDPAPTLAQRVEALRASLQPGQWLRIEVWP